MTQLLKSNICNQLIARFRDSFCIRQIWSYVTNLIHGYLVEIFSYFIKETILFRIVWGQFVQLLADAGDEVMKGRSVRYKNEIPVIE